MNIPIWMLKMFLTFPTSLLIIYLYNSVFHPKYIFIKNKYIQAN